MDKYFDDGYARGKNSTGVTNDLRTDIEDPSRQLTRQTSLGDRADMLERMRSMDETQQQKPVYYVSLFDPASSPWLRNSCSELSFSFRVSGFACASSRT
jgi:hypothetical protein